MDKNEEKGKPQKPRWAGHVLVGFGTFVSNINAAFALKIYLFFFKNNAFMIT